MNYWLIKSEPSTWSFSDQKKASTTIWDGVRNFQARNNLRFMKKNDLCFFYHSVNEKQINKMILERSKKYSLANYKIDCENISKNEITMKIKDLYENQ